MDYTITLTEAQRKAMEYVTVDVKEWIANAATSRAETAIDKICSIYTKYKLEHNEPITAVGKAEMVDAAYSEGLIQTLVQHNASLEAQMP